MPTQTINLNNSLPAAPTGGVNIKWQGDPPSLDPTVVRNVSAYYTPGLVVGFGILSATTGNNIAGGVIAPRAASLSECKVLINKSDSSAALTIRIKQNGTDIFSADPTFTAGTTPGTLFTFTNLTASPLLVAVDDVFTIDVVSGTSSWAFTAQVES